MRFNFVLSAESTKFCSIGKPCTYNSVCDTILAVRKLTNARVRIFYVYENFCDHSINTEFLEEFFLQVLNFCDFSESQHIVATKKSKKEVILSWPQSAPFKFCQPFVCVCVLLLTTAAWFMHDCLCIYLELMFTWLFWFSQPNKYTCFFFHTWNGLESLIFILFSFQFSSLWNRPNSVLQPLYVYSNIPFGFLANGDAAYVRLPSVLWGIVSVASTAVLSWFIFAKARMSVRRVAAISAAATVCVSPCHHFMSQLATGTITTSVFVTTGLSFLLYSVTQLPGEETPSLPLYLGTVLLALTAYTHSGLLIVTAILFLAFCISFQSKLRGKTVQCSLLMVSVFLPSCWTAISCHSTHVDGPAPGGVMQCTAAALFFYFNEVCEHCIWMWSNGVRTTKSKHIDTLCLIATQCGRAKKFVPSLARVVFLHIDHVQN